MKKTLSLLAAAALCTGLLAACGGAAGQPDMTNAMAASDDGAQLQITPRFHEKEYLSEDGKTVLGKYEYTVPRMTGAADEASAAVVESFNNEVDAIMEREAAYWDEVMADAQAYYDYYGAEHWETAGHWSDEMHYTVNRTETLASICYTRYIYTGGNHGFTYYTSQFFAMKEGKAVTLEEMTDDTEALEAVIAAEILRQIGAEELAERCGYWDDYADYVNAWMADECSVYFNEAGNMEITFPAYVLASYAAGEQVFEIAPEVYGPALNDYGRVLLQIA